MRRCRKGLGISPRDYPVEPSESMNSPNLFHPQSQGSTPHGLTLTPISQIDVKKHLTSIFISDKINKSLYKVP